jgi:hypothetical protein
MHGPETNIKSKVNTYFTKKPSQHTKSMKTNARD